jgi:hypothetical protein
LKLLRLELGRVDALREAEEDLPPSRRTKQVCFSCLFVLVVVVVVVVVVCLCVYVFMCLCCCSYQLCVAFVYGCAEMVVVDGSVGTVGQTPSNGRSYQRSGF